ncbi:uncharacterized protein LTR77_010157 [Saxophila tyrrhenica]|uniref:DUF7730 domain-containing protein n=1 Tax=Saxophila tyrrhenica TaxID=1690608 RepID=A0AAV9NX09_9PEZI|nr:hypothetical protein LTR77_010157 [Saxophila tyrrhenica]
MSQESTEDTLMVVPPSKYRRSERLVQRALVGKANLAIEEANAATPLLSLPPEIRNRIYTLVLCPDTLHVAALRLDLLPWVSYTNSVYVCKASLGDHEAARSIRDSERLQPYESYAERHHACRASWGTVQTQLGFPMALLRTCRQTHSEAALLPFEEINFTFYAPFLVHPFLEKLLPSQRKAIRSITLEATQGFNETTKIGPEEALVGLEGLKAVTMFEEHRLRKPINYERVPHLDAAQLAGLKKKLIRDSGLFRSAQPSRAMVCVTYRRCWGDSNISSGCFSGLEQTAAVCEVEAKLLGLEEQNGDAGPEGDIGESEA